MYKLQRRNKMYVVTKDGKEFNFSTLRAGLGFIKATRPSYNWPTLIKE